MSTETGERHWFRARRYGWGWEPATWEGWLVMVLYVVGMAGGGWWLLPQRQETAFLGWTGLLTTLLLAISWLKGETPGWRWGDRQ